MQQKLIFLVFQGYPAGMAYILSKEALKRFNDQIISNNCRTDAGGAEDLEVGICLRNNTIQVDTRDENHKHTFYPTLPEDDLNPFGQRYWYHTYQFYKIDQGSNCCSDMPIGFHYIDIENMYLMDYLFYRVHPFGVGKRISDKLPKKVTFRQMLLDSIDVKV